MAKPKWRFWQRDAPNPELPVHATDFGVITNGEHTQVVSLAATGAIDPREAERLVGSARVRNLRIDLPGVLNDGLEVGGLSLEDWYKEYFKMLRDDTIQDAMKFIYSSLRTASYYIEPASEDTRDLDIAAFIADSLGLDGKRAGKYPYGRLLKSYYQALIFRRSAMEIVLTLGQDGLAVLDKLVPIHPVNLAEVERDARGGPQRLVVRGLVQGEAAAYREVKLPMFKSVLFVHDDDGDLVGNSILEGAWVNWKIKRAMLQLINAGFERFLLGIPVLKLPKSVVRESLEWQGARNTLTAFAAKPRTGMLVPDGYEFSIEVVNAQMPDALPYLSRVVDGIYRSMGLGFLTSEGDSGGNYKLSDAVTKASGRYMQSLLIQFLEYINTYLIPKLVLVNWPEAVNFPTLKVDESERADPASVLNAYSQMVSASQKDGSFDAKAFAAVVEHAPSAIRRWMGFDADKRRQLVGSRRRSVR
jgi:hypothetical protein